MAHYRPAKNREQRTVDIFIFEQITNDDKSGQKTKFVMLPETTIMMTNVYLSIYCLYSAAQPHGRQTTVICLCSFSAFFLFVSEFLNCVALCIYLYVFIYLRNLSSQFVMAQCVSLSLCKTICAALCARVHFDVCVRENNAKIELIQVLCFTQLRFVFH